MTSNQEASNSKNIGNSLLLKGKMPLSKKYSKWNPSISINNIDRWSKSPETDSHPLKKVIKFPHYSKVYSILTKNKFSNFFSTPTSIKLLSLTPYSNSISLLNFKTKSNNTTRYKKTLLKSTKWRKNPSKKLFNQPINLKTHQNNKNLLKIPKITQSFRIILLHKSNC